MKIYIVFKLGWDHHEVWGTFLSHEKAELYVKSLRKESKESESEKDCIKIYEYPADTVFYPILDQETYKTLQAAGIELAEDPNDL